MNKKELNLEEMYEAADASELFNRARWVTLEEARLLHTIAKEEAPDFVFESGTANGFSTMWLALHGSDVFTFDPVCRLKVWDVCGKPRNVQCIERSFSNMPDIAEVMPGKKMFFIDGLHTSQGVKDDTEAVKEVVQDGDVIVFHDLNDMHVVRFWDRMNDHASSKEEYHTRRGIGKMVWAS